MLRKKAQILAPYKSVREYKDQYCTPEGIISQDRVVQVPMEKVLHHLLSRIFSDEMGLDLKDQMVALQLQGYTFIFHFKYGAGSFKSAEV